MRLISAVILLPACNFNPRTHRGVRRQTIITTSSTIYFNPRTHRGVRPKTPENIMLGADFNPRTHRGVRPDNTKHMYIARDISIHAPIVGCDLIDIRTD